MLSFVKREKITKDSGYVIWYDILVDTETGIEYFCIDGNLSPRVKVENGNATYFTKAD